ncbi:hypothetical protein DFQ26_005269 [Actinomortierella ambigua]|nr:hypothetical protein DFQ26_005269 [Actinomortierella ambigua]
MPSLYRTRSNVSSSSETQIITEEANPRLSLQIVEADDALEPRHDDDDCQPSTKIKGELRTNLDKHPKAVYFIFSNEFGERFCYHAIITNMNKFFMQVAGADQHVAKRFVTNITMLAFFFPLLALTIFSIPNLITPMSPSLAFLPLAIIALGSGGIKPCVSAHGGDQYLPTQERAKDQFFSWFFTTITLGTAVASFVVPAVADMSCMGLKTCYPYAFLIATIVFFLSLAIFAVGRPWYRVVPPLGEWLPWKALKAVVLALSRYYRATAEERADMAAAGQGGGGGSSSSSRGGGGGHWLNFAKAEYGGVFVDECRDFGLSFGLILVPASLSKMMFVQTNSEWATQYYQMSGALFGPRSKILAAQFSNVYPILVVAQMPLLIYVVYPFFERRGAAGGWDLRLTRRFAIGYLLIILSFASSAVLSARVEEAFRRTGRDPTRLADYDGTYCEGCVSGWAQFPQWFLMSLSECMYLPTGSQFMYVESGRSFRASAASFWLLTTSLGSVWVNLLDPLMLRGGLSTTARYWTYTAVGTAGLIIYLILVSFYVPRKQRPAINQEAREAKEIEYGLAS